MDLGKFGPQWRKKMPHRHSGAILYHCHPWTLRGCVMVLDRSPGSSPSYEKSPCAQHD